MRQAGARGTHATASRAHRYGPSRPNPSCLFSRNRTTSLPRRAHALPPCRWFRALSFLATPSSNCQGSGNTRRTLSLLVRFLPAPESLVIYLLRSRPLPPQSNSLQRLAVPRSEDISQANFRMPTNGTWKASCRSWRLPAAPSTLFSYSTAPRWRSRATVLRWLLPPNRCAYPNGVHSTISPGRS